MRNVLLAITFLMVMFVPAPSYAWGAAGHRYIMGRALDLLPAPMQPFFKTYREEMLLRVNDPDLWRVVGWEDDPNHFLDFGVPEYGAFPFEALPRSYDLAVGKFGVAKVRQYGTLPWREAEEFGNLKRAFEAMAKGQPFAASNAALFAAVASHYIQDATQPFHASDNYDGVKTGQAGIHSRFESALVERYLDRLTITPAAPKPMVNPRDTAFDILLDSYKLVQPTLAADKEAIAGKDAYDDEYFDRFLARVKPTLELRLSEAITQTASMIIGAWEAAGRPELKTEFPRTVQKVRPTRQ